MIGGAYVERYGIQVQVRSNDYDLGDSKAQVISAELTEDLAPPKALTMNGSGNFYIIEGVSKSSGPIPLGKSVEDSKRYLFSINFTIALREE